ncbi:transcriptional regulator, LuxR family [Intrasporangium calvum DSM 43043]|uniref:Transcriptional regulator, LuxR family n=1 Tax=Intrasporangium calvum (strain ATCC 23552 / DSM 43043 / JCM 3097 / NBRC 12989 / NCIMB 10167 / NRRL B-3866 / 7 KIP) TaxID=710696 RepID=E6SCV1_INTC7|nr:transcriptional regulator, LuxR family [Intrasporangium calvum DSM 43043]
MVSVGSWTVMVGRDAEQRALAAAIEAARTGTPSAVLVGGEAGVGKTRLVTEVTAAFEQRGVRVLWGRCLRFGSAESSLQPIGRLLTQWFRQADVAERERVLHGLPIGRLAQIAPVLGDGAGEASGQLIPALATVLERISEAQPSAVIIDDLQWADTTSLDLLAYIVAGFGRGQDLVVLATYRDSDLHEGHRLHGWLADVRRLPLVAELHLEPLGLQDTEDLVAALCGQEGAVARGAAVFERSGGNPYLTELLALASSAGGHQGAAGLRDALLASWHRLSPPAREMAQLLAVGGRPVDRVILEHLAVVKGLSLESIRGCVPEIVGAGLGTVTPSGQVWFRHPLLSEVLVSTLSQGELREVHGEYARLWAAASNAAPAGRAAHLALHHAGAHHFDEAFEWSLRAADAAAGLFAWPEEFEHLHRACQLWTRVSAAGRGTGVERVPLLGRTSDSAIRAGEYHLALQLREAALRLVDRRATPLVAARLQINLDLFRRWCGRSAMPMMEPELLSLTERFPHSPERAIALSQLAISEVWAGQPTAAHHADEAVLVARRSGSDEALSWALGARSQTRWEEPAGLDDAERAMVHARASGDHILVTEAVGYWANCLLGVGQRAAAADRMSEVFRGLMATGSFYEAVDLLPSIGQHLTELGRWSEARDLLREGLSRRITSSRGGDLRRVAADLAARTGDLAAARQHLARARELSSQRRLLGGFVIAPEARVAVAQGDQVQALSIIAEGIPAMRTVDADSADELLVWAARAAADLATRPGEHVNAVGWLEKIERLRGRTPPPFGPRRPENAFIVAWARLYAAEAERCRDGGPRRPELWTDAVAACARAGLPWEQALASYRLAQSLLSTKGNRTQAASALREAARIAGELGAAPILADTASLAAQSHISLTEHAPADPEAKLPEVFIGLTRREREVLGHLVVGRTYAEIARDLFISDKTVSVHVSNLLRKTGTSSRIELADLTRSLDPE